MHCKIPSFLLLMLAALSFTCGALAQPSESIPSIDKQATSETADNDDEGHPTCLFPVGGGTIPDSLMLSFIEESRVDNPTVLIIPYAYAAKPDVMEAQLTRFTEQFRGLGVQHVDTLDTVSGQRALEQIHQADVIWTSGGSQNTLRNTLNKVDTSLIPAIRERYDRGLALVGGTSAGAAIISQVMIGGNGGNNVDEPGDVAISEGFGLWPEVIVDQHFTQRTRLWRLRNAISRNPDYIGIGIDESTGIKYLNKTAFRVVGEGTVTVLYQQGKEQQTTTLRAGDIYELEGH